jgi:L-malate glycosyltransferase
VTGEAFPQAGPADASRSPERPRLCVVGALVGRRPGFITTQGEILGDILAREGFPVLFTSSLASRWARPADIARTLVARRRDYDVLLVQTYSAASFAIADLASGLGQALGKRVVFHLHGGALPKLFERHPRWSRRVLGRGHLLVAPSTYLARAANRLGFSVRVIPNVLEVSEYPFRLRSPARPRLFWMRSFHPIYQPETAVRVIARVRARFPEARLVMAGPDKGLESDVRELATQLGLADAVRFAGFLDAAGKRREADAADIFLNTNRVDNQPVAVLEACALGLPVVATRVGGVADMLTDGKTGLLVEDGDDAAMAEAVERLVDDPALAARLSRSGRLLAECSAPSIVVEAWDDALGTLALPWKKHSVGSIS